ncbi:MAG: tagaturonate reductase [Lachnospirales bacterium]
MKTLNNELLMEQKTIVKRDAKKNKIIQFGGGNFLRAFVDYYLNLLNENDLMDSGVTLIQAIPQDTPILEKMQQQDYNYTLIERGMEKGETISRSSIIDIITDVINPYDDMNAYLNCAKSEELRFVVSNTTEAGIVYDGNCKFEDAPQNSFPGKVARFLYERYAHFKGDKTKGLVFLPCELIDNNGTTLKEIILKHISDWNLEDDFKTWVLESNYFTNTLVDRIVPGFPRNEISDLTEKLGYVDYFIVTSEVFNFWVIEGPTWLQEELPFHKLGLYVVWTKDATPYKSRKVRILNGGHTSTVLSAYICGFKTVGEMMNCESFNSLLTNILYDEVIPTLDLPKDDLTNFAASVFDRFKNPFIEHFLMDISLNSTSKYKVRVVPSIVKYYEINKKIPVCLTTSFAGLITFYRGQLPNGKKIELKDDEKAINYFQENWKKYNKGEVSLKEVVTLFASNAEMFGADLSKLDGFVDAVTKHTEGFLNKKALEVIENVL